MFHPWFLGFLIFPLLMLNIVATSKLSNGPILSRNKKIGWMVALWALSVIGFSRASGTWKQDRRPQFVGRQ